MKSKKNRKIYFYDNGIINSVTRNFNTLNNRTDVGALWENYIISERRKFKQQDQLEAEIFFWRTTNNKKLIYIEKTGDDLLSVAFKWNPKAKAKIPG